VHIITCTQMATDNPPTPLVPESREESSDDGARRVRHVHVSRPPSRVRSLLGAGARAGRTPAYRANAGLELRPEAPVRIRSAVSRPDSRGVGKRALRRGRRVYLVPGRGTRTVTAAHGSQ
jgi:hypothetical protein